MAVLGNIDALKPRIWLAALTCGILTADPAQVVWFSDGGPGFWRLRDAFLLVTLHQCLTFTMLAKTYGEVSNLGSMVEEKKLATIFVLRDDCLSVEKQTPFWLILILLCNLMIYLLRSKEIRKFSSLPFYT